jgi:hypothetical protein
VWATGQVALLLFQMVVTSNHRAKLVVYDYIYLYIQLKYMKRYRLSGQLIALLDQTKLKQISTLHQRRLNPVVDHIQVGQIYIASPGPNAKHIIKTNSTICTWLRLVDSMISCVFPTKSTPQQLAIACSSGFHIRSPKPPPAVTHNLPKASIDITGSGSFATYTHSTNTLITSASHCQQETWVAH